MHLSNHWDRCLMNVPAVWSAHEIDLRQFVTYAKTRRTPLVVLVFPFLQQPERKCPRSFATKGFRPWI